MKLVCQNHQVDYASNIAYVDADLVMPSRFGKFPHNMDQLRSIPPHNKSYHLRKIVLGLYGHGRSYVTDWPRWMLAHVQIVELCSTSCFDTLLAVVRAIRAQTKWRPLRMVYHSNTFNIPKDVLASLFEEEVGIVVTTPGPLEEEILPPQVIKAWDQFLLLGGVLQIERQPGFSAPSRSEYMNHFFGLFSAPIPLLAYQAPSLLEVPGDPLSEMVSLYDDCRVRTAEHFCDFNTILFKMQYRFLYQSFDILESYHRHEEAFNPNIVHVDLDGNIYVSSRFSQSAIIGSIYSEQRAELPSEVFFAGSRALCSRCRGCPVLPLCYGGDPWAADPEQDCLQKFTYFAPLWTYFMNGFILRRSIWDIAEAGFKHQELYLQFLDSPVYKAAVGKK